MGNSIVTVIDRQSVSSAPPGEVVPSRRPSRTPAAVDWSPILRCLAAKLASQDPSNPVDLELVSARQDTADDAQDAARLRFLRTADHALRTPLTSIIGYSEMLVSGDAGEVPDEQLSMLNRVLGNAEKLLSLVECLLAAGPDLVACAGGSADPTFSAAAS